VLAAQDGQLMASDQDLDLVGVRRPPAQHHQLEKAAQRQVDERPDHPHLQQDDSTRRRTRALLITRPLTRGTDVWHPTRPPGCAPNHWTPTEVAQLEASLRALATDHLDIYQMHSGSDEVVQNDWNWC
jgi:hypothetical protein